MNVEMNEHLGYRHGESKPAGQTNQCNGTTGKTVITDDGPVDIEVPRDREGSFEPLSSASTSGASPVSTRKSSRCTPAA